MIDRADALAALAEDEFDLVVVGGGITGAGVALDAATRGYSVALVERSDYAAGTSSRSSKLVHGGLRYLQNFDLGLVREALLERQLMVALAPHLVHPLPLVVAAFDGASPSRKIGVGLNLYDVMSVERRGRSRARGRRGRHGSVQLGGDFAEWSPERHRVISGEEVLELIPALAAREPTSGYLFYDCQTDDVRLVLTVLGEAERFGAVCANGCNVTELVRDSGGRAAGVRVRDDGGEEFVVRASNVVNATGVWADRLRPGELHDDARGPAHPAQPRDAHHAAPRGPAARRRRRDRAGRRRAFDLRPAVARAHAARHDRQRLRGRPRRLAITCRRPRRTSPTCSTRRTSTSARRSCPATSRGRTPACGRSSRSGDPKKSVDISRKAELYETSSGMVTITGGKLTTWRRMAKMTVDRLVEREARDAPCRTHEIPLGRGGGAAPTCRASRACRRPRTPRWPGATGMPRTTCSRRRASAASWPRRSSRGCPTCSPRSRYAARREQARTIGDVLLRRTRLGLLAGRDLDAGGPVVARVGAALAAELGWSDGERDAQIAAWGAEARAEGVVGSA